MSKILEMKINGVLSGSTARDHGDLWHYFIQGIERMGLSFGGRSVEIDEEGSTLACHEVGDVSEDQKTQERQQIIDCANSQEGPSEKLHQEILLEEAKALLMNARVAIEAYWDDHNSWGRVEEDRPFASTYIEIRKFLNK
jgi:hypothetical protein